jgi:phage/plasmid-like protein (TIGR03299 family)
MTSFTTRHLPWAKIGHVIDKTDVDAHEAAILAGLDFDVDSRDVAYLDRTDPDGTEHWKRITTRRALVNNRDGNWLSIVSTDYRPVQYGDAFNFLDEINPRYVAGGALSDGKQGFLIVQLPEHASFDARPGGEPDPHDLYVMVRTSHDLSKGIEVALLTLRGKCMNQLTLPSLTADAPQRWNVRHVGDPHAKLVEAKLVLQRAPRYAEVISNRIRQLTDLQVTPRRLNVILKHVLRPTLKNRDQMIDRILEMANRPTVGFEGTGWGAVNTVSEYFQWGRPTATRTAQSLFTDSLDGDGARYVRQVATALLSAT